MTAPTIPLPAAGQSDLLCTVAIIADHSLADATRMVAAARSFLEARFRFWEIIVVTQESIRQRDPATFAAVAATANLRMLVLRDTVDRYRRMPIAAAESIGDIVIFAAEEEFDQIDLDAVWKAAEASGHSVLLTGRRVSAVERVAAKSVSGLAGFRVEPDLLRSCAHFRDRLTDLLSRSDSDLAFRFPNRWASDGSGVATLSIRHPGRVARTSRLRRAFVAADLVAHAAPRLLKAVSVASLFGVAGSTAYGVYAVAVALLKHDLAPGWLTTSLAISGSTAFLCAALGCVALGVARVLNLLQGRATDEVLAQTSNIDQFESFDGVNVISSRP